MFSIFVTKILTKYKTLRYCIYYFCSYYKLLMIECVMFFSQTFIFISTSHVQLILKFIQSENTKTLSFFLLFLFKISSKYEKMSKII